MVANQWWWISRKENGRHTNHYHYQHVCSQCSIPRPPGYFQYLESTVLHPSKMAFFRTNFVFSKHQQQVFLQLSIEKFCGICAKIFGEMTCIKSETGQKTIPKYSVWNNWIITKMGGEVLIFRQDNCQMLYSSKCSKILKFIQEITTFQTIKLTLGIYIYRIEKISQFLLF